MPLLVADEFTMFAASWVQRWQRLPSALHLVLFAVSLNLLAALSVGVFWPSDWLLAVWWPTIGWLLVVVLLVKSSQRRWVLGAYVVTTTAGVYATGGQDLWFAAVVAGAGLIEILVILWLLERGGRDPRQMHGPEDLWRFVLAVCTGALLYAVLVALLVGVAEGMSVWATVRSIAPSHLAALLLFGLLPMRQLPSRAEAGPVEVAGQWLLVAVVVLLVFAPEQRLSVVFLTVPVLLWAALRSSLRVLAGQLLTAIGIAAAMTLRGSGPFAVTEEIGGAQTLQDAVNLVQLYAVTLALVMLTTFLVVQARRETAARVARRDRRLRLLNDQALTGVVELQVVEGCLGIVLANRIAVGFLGGTNRMKSAKLLHDYFVEDDRPKLHEGVHGLLAGALDVWHGELQADTDDGTRWFEVAVFLDPERDGPQQLVAQMLDVTARRTNEMRLRGLALHDPLTGLANRTLLLDRLEHALRTAPRAAQYAGLVVLDLDAFKPINDQYGHQSGDMILIEISRRLEANWFASEFVI